MTERTSFRVGMMLVDGPADLPYAPCAGTQDVEDFTVDYLDFTVDYLSGYKTLLTKRHIARGNGVYVSDESVIIRNKRVGDIEVFDSGRVLFVASPTLEDRVFSQFFSSPVVAAMAVRSGVSVVHASCASYKNRAILIVGASGVGKSTLAAYLSTDGWEMISDDLTLITNDDDKTYAWSSTRTSWLNPDSFSAVVGTDVAPNIVRSDGKFGLSVENSASAKPTQLIAVVEPRFTSVGSSLVLGVKSKHALCGLVNQQLAGLAMLSSADSAARLKGNIKMLCGNVQGVELVRPKSFYDLQNTSVVLKRLVEESGNLHK